MARLDPKIRKAQLLEIAIDCASQVGYRRVTRNMIAERANITPQLINSYFITMDKLRRAIMKAAISRGILSIIAEGIAVKDVRALKAPQQLKEKAIQHLMN